MRADLSAVLQQPSAADYETAARSYVATGDLRSAVMMLSAALTVEPEHFARLQLLDEVVGSADDPDELLALNEEEFFGLIAVRARWLGEQQRWGTAWSLMLAVVAYRPDIGFLAWGQPWLRTASIKKLRWVQLAGATFEAASALSSTNINARVLLQLLSRWRSTSRSAKNRSQMRLGEIKLLRNIGHVEAAIKLLEQRGDSYHADQYASERGYLLRANGNLEEAAVAFAACQAPAARLDEGDTLCELGRFSEAADCYQRHLSDEPDDDWATAALAVTQGLATGSSWPGAPPTQPRLAEWVKRWALGESWLLTPTGDDAAVVADALLRVARSDERVVIRVTSPLVTSARMAFAVGAQQLAKPALLDDGQTPLAIARAITVDDAAVVALAGLPFERQRWQEALDKQRCSGDVLELVDTPPLPPPGCDTHPIAWVYHCQLAACWLAPDSCRAQLFAMVRGEEDWRVAAALWALWRHAHSEVERRAVFDAAYARWQQRERESFSMHMVLACLLHLRLDHAERPQWWQQLGRLLGAAE